MLLGLFPLPIFLLPCGIAQLRIFEPRYIRLVKESVVDDIGFVLAMNERGKIGEYGTRVNIIDFKTLPDGLLGITIQGRDRVKISQVYQEDDKLWRGHITTLTTWSKISEPSGIYGEALQHLFTAYPQHAEQYGDTPRFDDLNWVCQRWLEILPMTNQEKQYFLSLDNLNSAKQFIYQLLHDEQLAEN